MIKLAVIGKMKNQELSSLCNDYEKRITRFDNIEISVLKDSTLQKESEKLLEIIEKFKGSTFVMSQEGKTFTSEEFSKLLENNPNSLFIIGGAYGLSQEVKNKATKIVSFSPMTFTHEFARAFLLEQLYRAKTITAKTGYHH